MGHVNWVCELGWCANGVRKHAPHPCCRMPLFSAPSPAPLCTPPFTHITPPLFHVFPVYHVEARRNQGCGRGAGTCECEGGMRCPYRPLFFFCVYFLTPEVHLFKR